MRVTKKQHYIPQLILREHCAANHGNSRQIWMLDRQRKCIKLVPISTTAQRKYMYEYKTSNGEINTAVLNGLENYFSECERIFSVILRKIHARSLLTPDDLECVHRFTGLQLVRTPYVQQLSKALLRSMPLGLAKNIEHNASLLFTLPHGVQLSGVGEVFETLVLKLQALNLNIGISTCASFVINDLSPVIVLGYFGTWDAVFFPVSSHLCLCYTRKKLSNLYIDMPLEDVEFVNIWSVISLCDRIYSSSWVSLRGYFDLCVQSPCALKKAAVDRLQLLI